MKYLLIIIPFLFVSCNVIKKSKKQKVDRDVTEQILTKTKRVGDTVTYEVPNVILKDTTIYTVNNAGTILGARYNKKGNIDLVNCMSSTIDEMREENRRMWESIKDKSKDKEESFDSDVLLYGFIGLGLLIVIVMGGMMLFFSKQIKALSIIN